MKTAYHLRVLLVAVSLLLAVIVALSTGIPAAIGGANVANAVVASAAAFTVTATLGLRVIQTLAR